MEACFAAGKNLFRDGETAEAEEGIAEPIGTTGRVLKHAKEEVSYLQCRECHSPFGNASKAIKAINPPVHEETIDPILVYGPGASKIFFNPHLHECEILTASASHLYSFTRPNISPAFYDVGWTGSAEEVNPFRCFFDRYGWSSESCYCCRNFIGWKFERLSEREEDEEENELRESFSGFLKIKFKRPKFNRERKRKSVNRPSRKRIGIGTIGECTRRSARSTRCDSCLAKRRCLQTTTTTETTTSTMLPSLKKKELSWKNSA